MSAEQNGSSTVVNVNSALPAAVNGRLLHEFSEGEASECFFCLITATFDGRSI